MMILPLSFEYLMALSIICVSAKVTHFLSDLSSQSPVTSTERCFNKQGMRYFLIIEIVISLTDSLSKRKSSLF